jgi:repressor LexA
MSTTKHIRRVLLDEFKLANPRPLDDIASSVGLADSSSLLYHLRALIKSGMIVRERKGMYRTILDDNDTNMVSIPFYGEARCGDGGNFLESRPEYSITMSTQVVGTNPDGVFALKAAGDSMVPYIQPGDLIIANQFLDGTEIDPGSFYVVDQNSEIMIKKVLLEANSGYLLSLNPRHHPIAIDTTSFYVRGEIIGIYRQFRNSETKLN